jgi:hypothetical protein
MNWRRRSLLVCNLLVTILVLSSVLGTRVALATQQGWAIISTLNGSTYSNYLLGVASIKESDAWAVGWYDSGGSPSDQTLTEHWNGTSWSIVSSPNPGTSQNHLFGVTAVSNTNVWAVGEQANGSNPLQTLIMHWDGSQWNVVTSPNQGSNYNSLHSVSAVSANDIWAVGSYFGTDNLYHTLAQHWDGTQWRYVSSPDPGTVSNQHRGVAAVTSNDAWAVGQYDSGNGGQSLTQHWNGTQWSTISHSQPNYASDLAAVTAIASNDVWAVGTYYPCLPPCLTQLTLTMHWNGTQWSIVSSPNIGSSYSEFHSVSPVASNYVWAVGAGSSNGPAQTLTEMWDGTQWSIVTSPNQGSGLNALYGASVTPGSSAASGGTLWAVGYYMDNNQHTRTLAMKYNVCTRCAPPPP